MTLPLRRIVERPWELADLSPKHTEWLAKAVVEWGFTTKWSAVWGRTLTPEMVSRLLWHGVTHQKAVRGPRRSTVALFQLTTVHLEDGVGNLELLLAPDSLDSVDPLLAQYLTEVFEGFPLRKLCFAAASDDMDMPACLSGCTLAGVLHAHRLRSNGAYADVNIYELWADDWKHRPDERSGTGTA